MVSSQNRRAVAMFSSRQDAESALNELKNARFTTAQISLVTKESDSNNLIDGLGKSEFFWYQAPPPGKATCGAITGSMVGAICGCLIGLGLVAVPGIGPLLAVGTTGATLGATLAGAGIGGAGGGLLESLIDSEVDYDQARFERDRTPQNDYLIIVNGTDNEVRRAEVILSGLQPPSEV